ncbi:MAG TPA: HU family DNA-binding protein [Flavobacteriales bacterium]|nr:HU family DNA-binding protein [Flavobacteriales bacterium]
MINKRELAKNISDKTLLSQKEALQVIDEMVRSIINGLEEDGEVSIVGFGKFFLYEHAARPVRNPKTQEEMMLKPYKSVKFKVSDKVKKHFKESE